MATTLSHSESRRLYSWWWDSHISPKNSKWLKENLTDMDSKVKAMIKLIEEDADSFARRAEMYYKKRPELIKLVEEFYRAYRALAERYDHATVELRQAHCTMVEALPNQAPCVTGNGSTAGTSSSNSESLLDPDVLPAGSWELSSANLNSRGYFQESNSELSHRGLKQLGDIFASEMMKGVERTNAGVGGEVEIHASAEVQVLKKVLAEIQAEKEAVVRQYQLSLQRLSSLERELKDAGGLDERASRAEIEIKVLKETLAKLEAEKDANLEQYNTCLAKLSSLENLVSRTEDETKGLKSELSGLEAEKEAVLVRYNQCLEMISILQGKISTVEENARLLNDQTEKAEAEVEVLKQALSRLNEEKKGAELQYEICLRRIAELESEISIALEDVKRLNIEVGTGAAKLKCVEEERDLLAKSNQSLQLAAGDLAQKIANKDQEVLQKGEELEALQALLQDEQSRFIEAEATLKSLQKLHSQSQEEQKALALELDNKLQMLKDIETCNHDLQGDLQQAKEENQSLVELNSSSSTEVENLQNEICRLKDLKGKLEEDFALQLAQSNALHQEILHLKEEIERLNRRYQELIEQLCLVGLDPESVVASFRDMQDENLKLKEACKKDCDEKNVLHEKLKEVNKILENNAALESSVSGLNSELEGSGERIRELKESCRLLHEEKSGIGAEKAILLSQLQMMTENMQKLFERNALAENSLSRANMELEGLREKSKGLEEFCQMLKDEKSTLLQERSSLLVQLQNVEIRLGNLEMRFSKLEEKCNDLERDKDSTLLQVNEMQVFLGIEKQERASYTQSSEFRMADLEKQVHLLQEERRLSKKEFEEQLDKAVNAQVEIFVLQKFIEDLEQKNLSLLFECQKSNKLMAEFETESLEQQVEIEFLLDEIEKLRKGINQLFSALQVNPVMKHSDKFDEEQISFGHMLDGVNNLKCSLLKNEDEKQKLAIENLVLSTLLYQLGLEGTQLSSASKSLEQDMIQQVRVLEKDKFEILEMNKKLRVDANKREEVLRGHLEGQHLNLVSLEDSCQALQEENFQLVRQNSSLLQKLADLEEKNGKLEEEYDVTLEEAITLGNLFTVFGKLRSEKAEEVKSLGEHLARVDFRNGDLKKEIEMLEEKLESKDAESRKLNGKIEVLQKRLYEGEDLNGQLHCQIVIGKEFLTERALELVQTEQKLQAAENLNAEFCSTIEELKRKSESSIIVKKNMEMQILTLSENFMHQKEQIEGLRKTNEDVLSEMGALHLEIEEHRMKEENLTLELHERVNEFELWEAEASSFYFDLQACSIREVYLDNKVHELTSACEHLEEKNVTKDMEIEWMKERFSSLESEIDGLKAQLSAYGPVVASLQKNVESLEHNVLHADPSKVGGSRRSGEDVTLQAPELNHQELEESRCRPVADGISGLLKMQARIEAVEKAMIERASRLKAEEVALPEAGAITFQKPIRTKVKLDAPLGESELWELKDWLSHGDNSFRKEARNAVPGKESEISQFKTANIMMKDIPLDQMSDRSSRRRSKRNSTGSESAEDQMLELCEPIEPGFRRDPLSRSTRRKAVALLRSRSRRNTSQKKRDPPVESRLEKEVGVDRLEVPRNSAEERYQDANRRKILERIESDAKKLMSVQQTVQELKSKMEMKKSKKANNVESERVKRQLLEVDEAILQLFSATNQLARDIQETPSSPGESSSVDLEEANSTIKKRVTERARKGSEKIGRLQFEVESIRYNVLQLEDDKKSKGKHRLPGSRTGIILRDFVYSGRRNSIRRRNNNACFCGCGRPLTLED